MTTQFPQTKYAGPHNEAIENGDGTHRILYNGFEVATLSYCEGYQWAQLYAKAPELLEALRECITEPGAACFARDTFERSERMERRLKYISELAQAAINTDNQPG